MASVIIRLMLASLLILGVASVAIAQPDLHAQLFGEADKAMKNAREKRADLFAPTSFAKGAEDYKSADEDFKKGSALDKIQQKLASAAASFNRSVEVSKLGEMTFTETTTARNDAIKVDAPKLQSELWRRAEELFRSAASQLEDSKLGGALDEAREARGVYRTAELEAITASMLGGTRELLRKADALDTREYAPKTLARAHDLASACEAKLRQNRYNNSEARSLAGEAAYEASHAMYLGRTIAQLIRQDRTFEDILLASEGPLQQVAAPLNVPARFDDGYEPVTRQILTAIQTPDTATFRMAGTIRRLEIELAAAKARVGVLEGGPSPSAITPARKKPGR